MKKTKLTFAFSCLAMLLLTTSCGGGGVKGNDHIIFWHTMGQQKREALNACIAEFNSINKGKYEVEALAQGGNYQDLANKLNNVIPAGTNPTMAWGYPDSFANFIGDDGEGNNKLVNLDTFINDPELGFKAEEGSHVENGETKLGVDDFVKGYYVEGTQYQLEGTYSMPFYKSTEVMYYNEDFFGGKNAINKTYEVPVTWEDAVALSKQIIADYKAANIPTEGFVPLAYDSDANLFISQCIQRDIPYTQVPKDANTNPFTFNNPKAIALVDELSSLIKDGYLVTKGVLQNNAYTSTLFTEEKCVMTIGSTGGSNYNFTTNFNVGIAPVPYANGNKKYVMQGPSICIFKNDNETNIKGAWEFYKFLSSSKWNTLLALENSYDPVRLSCYETEAYKQNLKDAQEEGATIVQKVSAITATLQPYYFTTPVFNGSGKAREEAGNLMSYVYAQKMTPEQAIKKAYDNCIL